MTRTTALKTICCLTFVLLASACSTTPESRAALHMKRGKEWITKQEPARAIIEFKVASQNAPKDAEPLFQLAMAYLKAGSIQLSYETLRKATDLNPKHEGARFQIALFKVGSDKPELVQEAQTVVAEHLTNQPGDPEAMASLALAAAKLGNDDEALHQLESAIAKDPANTHRIEVVLGVYAAKGDNKMLTRITHSLTGQNPNSPDLAVIRAEVALATGDRADADAEIARALSLRSSFVPALQVRLRREMLDGNPLAVERTARELAATPDKNMWAAYGKALFAENKVDEAIVEFDRILKAHSGDVGIRNSYSGLLLNSGRTKAALPVLNGTLALQPKEPAALLQRVAALVELGDLDGASRDVKMLQSLHALSAPLSYQQSRIFAARGDSVRRSQTLTEALNFDPGLLAARLDLAEMMVAQGNPRGALELLDHATADQRRTIGYLFVRNSALIASGDYAGARKGVNAGLASLRTDGLLYQDALLRLQSKDTAGARKALLEGFASYPNNAGILALLGQVMGRNGETADYLKMLRDAATNSKDAANLQFALGTTLTAQGDGAGARAAYEAARAAGDRNADLELARLEMQAGQPEKASQRLLELTKTNDTAGLRVILADTEARRGASSDVVTGHYLRALRLDPSNLVAMNNLANILASSQNKLDDARFWAEKALSLEPASPALADTVGWIYFRQAKYDAAITFLERSLKGKDRPIAHYHLAAALAGAGDPLRGKQEYQLALSQDPRSEARAAVAPFFEGK